MASSSGEIVLGISGAMKTEKLYGDRFSNLPDTLAHRILSFVNVDEFGRLMLVSKRFNQLCFSAPCLSMVNNSSTDDSSHRAKLGNFMSAYFSRRRKSGAKVERLRILWSFHQANPLALEYGMGEEQNECDGDDPVFTCLCRCTTYCDPDNVEVNLVLREGVSLKRHKISAYLFCLIRNATLSMNNTGFSFSDYGFNITSKLETLTLKSVRISCTSSYFDTDQFPKLKLLQLYDCSGIEGFVIWNRSVERMEIINEKLSDLRCITLGCFKLKTLLLTWYPQFVNAGLRLYLLELEHLEWKGFPLLLFDSTLPKQLKSSTVYCSSIARRKLVDGRRTIYMPFVLMSVSSAKSLRLIPRTIKIFIKQLSKGIHLCSLEGVETLHIDDCYLTDIEVPAIAFLLKMMPDLKSIHVLSSRVHERISFTPHAQFPANKKKKVKACIRREGSHFKVDYWEAQDLKFVQQLETATVEIHKEQGNAAELVKYFAEHCEHLENLQVICPSAMVSAVSGQIEVVKSNDANVTYVQA